MKKILVATDGSEAAQRAVTWAADFTDAMSAKVIAVTVIEPPGSISHGPVAEVTRQLEDEWVEPLAARDTNRELAVLEGDPRAELLNFVKGADVDAVVVGTRGAGGFRALGLGSVSHYLAHHLPCPLIAVPHAGGPLIGGTVIVGADGSTANEPALQWTAQTESALHGRAVAVFVHSPLADVMTHTAANWRYPGENDVRDAVARAQADMAPMNVVLAAGNPVQELMRVSREQDAALIVVGRRGWGGLHGLVLGRVPAQLLHHADRPVAVVPH